ncbi:MAG: hypothetical protein KGJ13_09275 [Patescibacteria group bacterium]|nr:hypothetical protein [Patescibacteria group bacterium]
MTLEDSRRAGNCVEGTLAWCERTLGLTRQEILDGGYLFSLPAAQILAANGGQPGVERAVKAAWVRETTVSI